MTVLSVDLCTYPTVAIHIANASGNFLYDPVVACGPVQLEGELSTDGVVTVFNLVDK